METEQLLTDFPASGPEWFCVRSKPKCEHIAAKHLEESGVEVFLPRIRFQRLTRRGKVWFNEALFPGYLFSRFEWARSFRNVCATNGVTSIVHFGENWPRIPAEAIEELRRLFGTRSLRQITPEFNVGDEVKIASGPFQGLLAVVNQVLPAPERVRVLLDFLGRQTSAEVNVGSIIPVTEARALAFQEPAEDEG
jgi:transcriptional antiterminator RfaH